ncbi:MAG: tyrosine--tRNA ligase [Haliscomenobacter sp.]|nr:tyrosine--tRNA ligase [Haliscomenobacter sp.]MBK8878413.1 tyrosine--tRNA ligase [Haliscomenobacter sp.]
MDFLKELEWRGLLQDMSPGLEEALAKGKVTGYIGFDPTAPSLTIGNYVPIMLLKLFQLSGHQPIVLMGGATGRIGDPSGKDKERELKSYDELDANLEHQKKQMVKLLDFEREGNPAILVNNLDFYKDMPVLEFLRTVGKTLTVNYMMSKESVQKRLETGISFTEFSYQLLQAYDFQCLYSQHHCILQMGGSDQWGNITSGTEFIRRNLQEKAYALTNPLLTKADGSKFGKSTEGNIWLDPALTSPYKFYQFWINSNDDDLPKLTRYFTLKSREEVEATEQEHAGNPQELKRLLAEELTVRIHGEEAYRSVLNVTELLFGRNAGRAELLQLSEEELATVAQEIPSYTIPAEAISNGVQILDLLAELTPITTSKGEARRAIQNNAISVNKEKIASHEAVIPVGELLHHRYLMIENGKKNKYLVQIRM